MDVVIGTVFSRVHGDMQFLYFLINLFYANVFYECVSNSNVILIKMYL